jgi:alanyl-tRNA synthetase
VADHARGVAFLIADDVRPSNKGAGYILRRLLRRLAVKQGDCLPVIKAVINSYAAAYPELKAEIILPVIEEEIKKFGASLALGLEELRKLTQLDAATAFQIYETYGLPFEVMKERDPSLSRAEFDKEFAKHQEVSRAGGDAKFKGGLADHEPATIKLHTAHHLLLAALKKVLGQDVKQRGSNITQERLRLDFSFDRKLTAAELEQVTNLVNEWIKADLPVNRQEMPKAAAEKLGAEMEFGGKYGETVSVYIIGPSGQPSQAISKEFCGGPHVAHTGELGKFKILKEEAVAAGVRRIKAVLT